MAVVQVSRIQMRRGLRIDLPTTLNDAEFGWAENTRELFIGNGTSFSGNSQILTQHSPASLPPLTYVSNTGTTAITGGDTTTGADPSTPNANFPIVRTYQQKFDDMVNIKDYGAVGDGITDDTAALLRAMFDVYDETSSSTANIKKFRSIYFPAGKYIVSQSIPLYPFAVWYGDGKGRSQIFLDHTLGLDPDITFLTGNDCVIRTVDSKGQSALNIGTGSPDFLPQKIRVFNMSFESNTLQTVASVNVPNNGSLKEIVKLDQVSNVRFEGCEFKGTWTNGNATIDGSIGVLISRLGDTSSASDLEKFSFVDCAFANTAYAFNVLDTITDVNVINSTFNTHYRAIKLGFEGGLDTTEGTGIDSIIDAAPDLFRVSNSYFEGVTNISFDVISTGRGNISSYNFYNNSGSTAAVRFGVNTLSAVSISDTFANTSAFNCSQKLTNLRVQNLAEPNTNIIMNAQDDFQIPTGFCGSITISGTQINNNDPVTPTGSSPTFLVTSIPYVDGNVIFFEYGMNLGGPAPSGIYRIGTLLIVTNGDGKDGAVEPDSINFTNTDNELDGPPGDTITFQASLNGISNAVDIEVVTVGSVPLVNFTIRTMTV